HKFWDHYSSALQKSFPCTGDRDTCPGCTAENKKDQRASAKFLVNAKDPDSGYTNLWKIPASAMSTFEGVFDKEHTIKGRIFEIYRGKNDADRVTYTVTREDPYKELTDEDTARKQDFEEALLKQYVEAWGEEPDDADSPVQSAPSPKPEKKQKRSKTSKGQFIDEIEARPEEEKPPFEETSEAEREVTEDELLSMSTADLLSLFVQAGIDPPDTTDPDLLREALIDALA